MRPVVEARFATEREVVAAFVAKSEVEEARSEKRRGVVAKVVKR